MNYDYINSLLPSELNIEANASNFKEVLKVYASVVDIGLKKSEEYGDLLDVNSASGFALDSIGKMFSVFREILETDDVYRNRIIATSIKRKTPVTIPEMQQAVSSIVTSGELKVLENHNGRPASIYLTGTSNEADVTLALSVVSTFLPAGVLLIVPVVSFETWNSIATQFATWASLTAQGYIW